MKTVNFKNRFNGEKFICEDIRSIETIDGVEYVLVHRPGETRLFKMRRDALEKDTAVVKGISQNFAKV